ncbi:MAG: PAS domain S-box protein [candidate division Zixibacteria bacterium]|nr:PAS domain S-box protein [candidate division Zixibacteria bacterium]
MSSKSIAVDLNDEELKLYHALVESSCDWDYLITGDGNIQLISPACKRITGYAREEFENNPSLIEEIIHPEDKDLFMIHQGMERDSREPLSLEFRIISSDGSIRWVNHICYPLFDEENLYRGRRVSVRDITERRRIEDALRESEELHRITLSNINDAVFITNDDLEFTYVCINVDYIFGYNRGEVEAMGNISELLGENLFEMDDLRQRKAIFNIERRVADKFGNEHDLSINIKSVSIKDGTILFTCHDITELRRAEEDLKVINSKLDLERRALREKNVALNELMKQIDKEKNQIIVQIQCNLRRVIYPLLNKMEGIGNKTGREYINLLKKSLDDIISPFSNKLENDFASLTPREIEVCNLIKEGMTSSEIASTFNTSVETVRNQRKNIRRKLKIANNKINLASYLQNY